MQIHSDCEHLVRKRVKKNRKRNERKKQKKLRKLKENEITQRKKCKKEINTNKKRQKIERNATYIITKRNAHESCFKKWITKRKSVFGRTRDLSQGECSQACLPTRRCVGILFARAHHGAIQPPTAILSSRSISLVFAAIFFFFAFLVFSIICFPEANCIVGKGYNLSRFFIYKDSRHKIYMRQ